MSTLTVNTEPNAGQYRVEELTRSEKISSEDSNKSQQKSLQNRHQQQLEQQQSSVFFQGESEQKQQEEGSPIPSSSSKKSKRKLDDSDNGKNKRIKSHGKPPALNLSDTNNPSSTQSVDDWGDTVEDWEMRASMPTSPSPNARPSEITNENEKDDDVNITLNTSNEREQADTLFPQTKAQENSSMEGAADNCESSYMYQTQRKRHRPGTSQKMQDPTIYRYPVILQDDGAGSDVYRNYGINTNKLWKQSTVGAIKCQRQCSVKNSKGGKWIIECYSKQQQFILSKTSSLKSDRGIIKFTAWIPEEKTEGVVGPIPLDITSEEIAQLISENKHQNIHISDIFRLKTKAGERSKAVKLIFFSSTLPSSIQIGTRMFRIEPYRREVKRCTRCQRLDHDKRECKSKQPPRCPKCLQEAHPNGAMECPLPQRQWKCANCSQRGHSSAYGGCPEINVRKKALELQAKEYMPIATAIARVRKDQASDAQDAQNRKPKGNKAKVQSEKELRSSSPVRRLNYAAATKVGKPNVSAIIKDNDHISFKFKRPVPKMPDRKVDIYNKEETTDKLPAVPSASQDQPSAPLAAIHSMHVSKAAKETCDSTASQPKDNSNHRDPPHLLDNIQNLLDRHLAAVESRMSQQSDNINKKLQQITEDLHKQSKQREQQMELAARLISKGREATANPVVKTAFDILECVRQAAQGNTKALMTLALRFSQPEGGSCTPPTAPKELQLAVANIIPPRAEEQ